MSPIAKRILFIVFLKYILNQRMSVTCNDVFSIKNT